MRSEALHRAYLMNTTQVTFVRSVLTAIEMVANLYYALSISGIWMTK